MDSTQWIMALTVHLNASVIRHVFLWTWPPLEEWTESFGASCSLLTNTETPLNSLETRAPIISSLRLQIFFRDCKCVLLSTKEAQNFAVRPEPTRKGGGGRGVIFTQSHDRTVYPLFRSRLYYEWNFISNRPICYDCSTIKWFFFSSVSLSLLSLPPQSKKKRRFKREILPGALLWSILNHNTQCSCLLLLMLIFVWHWLFTLIPLFRRTLFGSVRDTGLTKANTTRLVQRLASIHKRPNYRRTGTHPFPRSVSVWRLTDSWGSPLSTARLPLFTLWLLMVITGSLYSVGTSG